MNERITADTEVVSFDVWLTLIKSNGRFFKNIRNEYLGSLLAPNMSTTEFDTLMRAQDVLADTIAEERGNDVLFHERVNMVARAAGTEDPSEDMLESMYEHQGALFQKNLPLLLDAQTPELLQTLKNRGHTLAIISNTGYMHGDQMRPALEALKIAQQFDHLIFSNEVGYAKPDARIFQTLLDHTGVDPARITHVGDNPRADVRGATAIGMRAILFGGDVTLKTIVEDAQ